jgi:monofunctional biosynthetic peptidoglycan transglycosylase
MDQKTGDAPKPEEPLVVPAAVLPDEPVGESAVEPVAPPTTPTAPASQPANPISPSKPKRKPHWVRRSLIALVLLLFVVPPVLTVIYRVVPPPITILMMERLAQGQGLDKQWRGLSDISPALPQAVIAAEDARFCEHHGFDFEAIRKAALHNQRRPGKVRGGSTISQQTAKNVFLWPSRDYVRKGLEAWFTVLEEAIWGKRRILETYLNVVEWGPGTYGAEAAARRYFHKDAADLTPAEAARLAAILPDPLKWKAANPGPYVQRRSAKIGARAAVVRDDDLAWCVRR